jgi:hypothetical protein
MLPCVDDAALHAPLSSQESPRVALNDDNNNNNTVAVKEKLICEVTEKNV